MVPACRLIIRLRLKTIGVTCEEGNEPSGSQTVAESIG